VLRKLTTGPYGEHWSSTFVSRRRHAEWNEFTWKTHIWYFFFNATAFSTSQSFIWRILAKEKMAIQEFCEKWNKMCVIVRLHNDCLFWQELLVIWGNQRWLSLQKIKDIVLATGWFCKALCGKGQLPHEFGLKTVCILTRPVENKCLKADFPYLFVLALVVSWK